ncbi:DUF3793 family protein [Ruminococcus sp.]|uniref:DUF3793 family protein n=1 Tax=Ruminococcus sp. TaxID=41978 RepID=UPI00388EF9D0
MSEEALIRYCSPTLAGIKTGSLFSCSYHSETELFSFLRTWNIALREKGIRIIPLRTREGKALIYVFRPSQLETRLQEEESRHLLEERGYCSESCSACLTHLISRLSESEDFPHEIGLFLGYPCEDVKGFIDNKAACAKYVGCWKVYGDEVKARKQFERFKKCTRIYQQQWADGKPLTRLTVTR